MSTPLKKYLKTIVKTVAGPSSYPSGGFSVSIGELQKVLAAIVQDVGGGEYLPQVAGISGNTVTIKVRDNIEQAVNEGGSSTYTIGGEVSAGSDLSGVKFQIIAFGY
ncbi:MAG: hypothetical protein QXH03_02720 [Candidatus Bathyarchaeia archaeon]